MQLENFPEVCFKIAAYNLISIQKLWTKAFIIIAYGIKFTKRCANDNLISYNMKTNSVFSCAHTRVWSTIESVQIVQKKKHYNNKF